MKAPGIDDAEHANVMMTARKKWWARQGLNL